MYMRYGVMGELSLQTHSYALGRVGFGYLQCSNFNKCACILIVDLVFPKSDMKKACSQFLCAGLNIKRDLKQKKGMIM